MAQGFLVSPCLPHPPQAKTKGNKVNVGVKYAEKQERKFEPEKLREGRNIIGLQVPPLLHPGLTAELSRGSGSGGGWEGALVPAGFGGGVVGVVAIYLAFTRLYIWHFSIP